ncbi:PrsW family glutamic-type intramembrane protease [Ilumatobacter sp.]|uniref:PrsW family glutamic-type intramembrane protease n=1 Tax=Ilumatobacter sp. TaxID=1967498 RepID=UPI003AF55CCF
MSDEFAAPPGAATPPGWYADPTSPDRWRWWNGHAWTTFVADPSRARRPGGKPRLPRWSSVPVVVCAPFVVLLVGILAFNQPISVPAGLVPLVIVLPVLSWLDRVEPEPTASRVHAVLWGACVAVSVSIVANVLVAVLVNDLASMVISAPVVEEAAKGAGIVWALRRREVDGITDGVVYAGWIALGFAVVEDMTYFSLASIDGDLLPVFIVRAILTPFAHPLFTFWTGLALGRAVQRGTPIFPSVLWGYALAVGTHALWNGSLAIGEIRPDVTEDVEVGVVLGTALLFVVLFLAVSVTLVWARRREQRRFVQMWPFLMQRYGLSDADFGYLDDWASLRRARRDVPRRARRSFDQVHAVLARLAMLHERLNDVDPVDERVLTAQLAEARADLARKVG